MTGTILGMFVALAALVMLNVPIGIALGVMALGAIVLTQGAYMLPNLALVMFEGATNFSLLAIPMFILAGAIMNSSSITTKRKPPSISSAATRNRPRRSRPNRFTSRSTSP